MSKMAHTPGPWFVLNDTDVFTDLGAANALGIHADDSDGWHIADCSMGATLVGGECVEMDYAERQANARLIAAAPDLLVALEQLVSDYERGIHVEFGGSPWLKEKLEELDYARAAIAKATGASDG